MAAAATLPEALVLASDIDRVAVDVAEANVAINELQGRVECLEAAGLNHGRIRAAAPFDLIFANILKGPLIELAPGIAAELATGGRAILSGLLAIQAEAVTEAYVASGLCLQSRDDIGEWSTLVVQKL
jgi:ribosomal protein L11 methyltransferase